MPLLLDPRVNDRDLIGRLANLQRRGRMLVTLRGVALVALVLVGPLLVLGLLDRWLDVPALGRAIALAGWLLAIPFVARRTLFAPRKNFDDDVTLALRLEERFPELNDALASTVEFARRPNGSPALRRAVEQLAVREAEECNFNELLADHRPTAPVLAALAALVALATLTALDPAVMRTVGLRFFDPFGDHPWPPQTTLDIDAPEWLPRGEPFVLRGTIHGVVPERASFSYALEGTPLVEQTLATSDGALGVRLEPNRVSRSFRYQVRANDAVTPWKTVAVRTPPQFVALDGRPSPHVRLDFPRYTGVPAVDVPDGGGSFETITGTLVHIRAALDRPVRRAWVELDRDPPRAIASAALLPVGTTPALDRVGRFAAGQGVWGRFDATVSADGKSFAMTFLPHVPGIYSLRAEDESGLSGRRTYDIRVVPDPSPLVALDRPSPSRDSLSVLPNASLTVAARIDDPTFAVRSAALEYRTGRDDVPRRVPLGDVASLSQALPRLLTAYPVTTPGLRPTGIVVEQRIAVASLRHHEGRALRDGDVVTLAAIADDFDDVTPWKAPGRSHEVELRVVAPAALDAQVQKAKADVQRELRELHKLQRDALDRAQAVEQQRRETGKLRPEDAEKLLQAEQMQQQLAARLGSKDDGVRGAVAKLQQALRDNPLPNSPEKDRLDALAGELERLAAEELGPAEQQLAAARKERETVAPDARKSGPLPQALRHQKESERTLREMQEQLKPWTDARELRTESGMLERDLDRLDRQRDALLRQPGVRGTDADQLTPQQREELNRLQERLAGINERAADLLNKLNKRLNDRQQAANAKRAEAENAAQDAAGKEQKAEAAKGTPGENALSREAREARRREAEARESADNLRREADAMAAARDAAEPALGEQLKQAAERLSANKLGDANAAMQRATGTLRKMQAALAEPEQKDGDRLVKKLAEAEKDMAELIDEQERLQKKAADAARIENPAERQREIDKLTREQEQLQERTRELAQRLSRLKGEDAGRELRRAGRAMEKAGEQMAQGEDAEGKQDDALDRLDDAQAELAQAKEQAEEELEREKRAKVVDAIRGLRDRQAALVGESERIFLDVKAAKAWSRATHQKSLFDVADAEKGLGEEVTGLVDAKFREEKVIAYLVKQAAEAMASVNEAVEAVRDGLWSLDTLDDDRANVQAPQTTALKRLDQLLEALKDDPKDKANADAKPPGGDMPEGAGGGGGGDGIPPLAQLKVLRALQAEVNERTASFDQKHPDPEKWTPREKDAIGAIRTMQADLAALFEEIAPPPPEPADEAQPKAKTEGKP